MSKVIDSRKRAAAAATVYSGRLSAWGRLRRHAVLSGMGLTVLAATSYPHLALAAPPRFGSGAWFAQQNVMRANPPANTPASQLPAGSQVPGGAVTPQQALQKAQQSMQDLNHAMQAIAAAQAAQRLSAQQALSGPDRLRPDLPDVSDGLGVNGLQVGSGVAGDPSQWQNASAPVQTSSGGQTTVTITQTAQKAVLTWDTFNVGRHTTVDFDQSAGKQANGSNNWIALNRVTDPSANPTQILGNIKADGSVYLINSNGIIFGGSSQVNVHSLLASSLSLFSSDVATSNQQFFNQGIAGGNSSSSIVLGIDLPAPGAVGPGDISIQAGAAITTGKQGFSLIAAPNISNAGTITAADGQAILAAGSGVRLDGVLNLGANLLTPSLVGTAGVVDGVDTTPAFSLSNTGLIEADRGNVTLLGYNVTQGGVVAATTSVTNPGSIVISALDEYSGSTPGRAGAVTLATGSTTAVLPDGNGQTTTSSSTASAVFQTGNVSLTGGTVTMEGGSLLEAPGANVSLTGLLADNNPATGVPGRVFLAPGATIDVSGLADVELPVADTLVTIPRVGQNELADSPLLRDGFLFGQSVVVDSTMSGTRADGETWQGSPIVNASGYIQNVPRTVNQLLTAAGSVKLVGHEVIAAKGSTIDLDGGYVNYLGGMVTGPTRLLGADGKIYDISNANPDIEYVGFAGTTSLTESRWGVTQVYNNPLLSGNLPHYESGFIQGGSAGALSIYAAGTAVLDVNLSAHAFAGRNQVLSGSRPAGGTFSIGATATAGNVLGQLGGGIAPPSVIITSGTPGDPSQSFDLSSIAPDFNAGTSLATPAMLAKQASDSSNILYWTPLSATALSNAGFNSVSVSADSGHILVDNGARLAVQPGGRISLSAATDTILGDLVASSGKIGITASGVTNGPTFDSASHTPGDIVVGPNATLSTRGQWINDGSLSIDQMSGSQYINGGSISLSTTAQSYVDPDNALNAIDSTGSIRLQQGSVLDVSSGGYVTSTGVVQARNGVPVGNAGSISLTTYAGVPFGTGSAAAAPTQPASAGTVQMDGTLLGYGFSNGGTLSIQALGFQIGGDPAATPAGSLNLPTQFFSQGGFGNYVLSAEYGTTVAAGATLRLTQDNFIPNYAALLGAASGADLYSGNLVSLGALDAYHRAPTNLSLSAGGYLAWGGTSYNGVSSTLLVDQGAVIQTDAGARVQLGSAGQVAVLGAIKAPAGTIVLDGLGIGTQGQADTTPAGSVWLGSGAVLDASGTSLINPLAPVVGIDGMQQTQRTGKVLAGGTVELFGGDVAVQHGAGINVSGASDTYDVPQSTASPAGQGSSYAATPVWSDAGQVVLGAGDGLFFDGSLSAHGGAAAAEGGGLTITALNSANAVILQAGGAPDLLPQGWQPGAAVPAVTPGTLYFGVDHLASSGISSLNIGSNTTPTQSQALPGVIQLGFSGDVSLKLGKSFVANASNYVALPAGSMAIATSGDGTPVQAGTVSITAPYVSLQGYYDNNSPPPFIPNAAPGTGTLNVNAAFIDLNGQFGLQNFAQANFTSSGDIRFYTDASRVFHNSAGVAPPGELFTTGDLAFTAAQLYPASGNSFIVDAAGPQPTTVTIQGNGAASQVPLSAGGSLLIDATNIVQSGTIRAPDGSIVLGVRDPADAATQAQFNNLPLVATQSLSLAAGSLTSVSLGNTVVPYGTTLDGTEWQYNTATGITSPDLTAPPVKQIALNGASVGLDQGATVDLSGGGDLQAREWVPGTGGSRNVLQQFNTSFASSASGTQVPLYPDARPVYAIIPGYSAPVAAYDAVAMQGQGGMAAGKAVYLSGVPGLPAGVYALLPASYATLPGAYRVVQNTAVSDSLPSQNMILPDGTASVSGYFVDSLSGARASRSTTFQVQSGPVWQQYSQYTLTSANSFFPGLAAHDGKPTPQLPVDAGQLILGATGSLTLGASLNTAAGKGGAPAQIDIASQDIQIVGSGETALDGYLQLSATALDSLNAGSLLIGGTRSQTADGINITALANSVVVSTDAQNPLQGPEIILVTKTDPTQQDPNAANGLRVDSGSVIQAKGSIPANIDQAISIGTADVSGDGTLLRVSNGAAVAITRNNVPGLDGVPGTAAGRLEVQAGASIAGGSSLTLDSSGNTLVDPAAVFSGKAIAADGGSITFVTGKTAPDGSGLVIGSDTLAQFANAQQISLRSYGNLDFEGDINIDIGGALNLSAASFSTGAGGQAGNVSIKAGTLGLSNEIGGAGAAGVAGSGTLSLSGNEVDFGSAFGNKANASTFSGFGSVQVSAGSGIVGLGQGSFDFGGLPLSLSAPVIVAGTGSKVSLGTTGALSLASTSGTPLAAAGSALGGSLSLSGGSIDDQAVIRANAGAVRLEATSGDLGLGSGAAISVAGLGKQFYDTTQYAPGGSISLVADQAMINAQSGSILDFSAASGGGNAGSLSVSAGQQTVSLAGTLKGGASAGNQGGSFSERAGGAIDLDSLATTLAAAGVDQSISVESHSGNLQLSAGNTLRAQQVALTADGGTAPTSTDGNVIVDGTIDASGAAGGQIDLYGRSGVALRGTLKATGSDPHQRGGTVNLGTSGSGNGSLNASYGYENVDAAASGTISIAAAASIDVSGGSAGGLSGGTVNLRAPLLSNGDVNVNVAPTAQIQGARDVGLEAYAVWSTSDAGGGSQHFDGIVDPAGWYDASGNLLPGVFTTPTGARISYNGHNLTPAQLAQDLAQDAFTPNQPNAAHSGFYQTTLANYVETPGFAFESRFAGIANFHARPGIDLENPQAGVNNGSISVLSNWNLGAMGDSGLIYRYNGQAPVLSLRAANNLAIDASISDGFYQAGTPFINGVVDNSISPVAGAMAQAGLSPLSLDPAGLVGGSSSYRFVAGADLGSADPLALQDAGNFAAGAANYAGGGNITVDGHFVYTDKKTNGLLDFPTVVRTGTGAIDIAAGGGFDLLDTVAPGAIYTGGAPSADAASTRTVSVTKAVKPSGSAGGVPEILVTGTVSPDAAGNISITAQQDISGVEQVYDTSGRLTGKAGDFLGQFWWPWMQTGLSTNPTQSTINFGAFDQGVLSAGGNVSVSAGGSIRDLSVSLPTTWYLGTDPAGGAPTVVTVGGGNLSVKAGGDILSGAYFVSNGSADLSAGGRIGSDFSFTPLAANTYTTPVSTLLALQNNSTMQVSARGDLDIGGVYNPSYLHDSLIDTALGRGRAFDSQSYGPGSALSLFSTTGDIAFDTLTQPYALFGYGLLADPASSKQTGAGLILPSSLNLTAMQGAVSVEGAGELYPSATGNLSIFANQTVSLYNAVDESGRSQYLGLIDGDASLLPSPLNPLSSRIYGAEYIGGTDPQLHLATPLHEADTRPVRIYSLGGSIVDGMVDGNGIGFQQLVVAPSKPAQLRAGNDIVDLAFLGQNLHTSDLSLISAGRDIVDTPLSNSGFSTPLANPYGVVPSLLLSGPGTFDVEAGRDIGPLTNQTQVVGTFYNANGSLGGIQTGIDTIGSQQNPFLPHQGANLVVLFGIGPGVGDTAFIGRYIDPASAGSVAGVPSFVPDLINFMEQYQAGQGGAGTTLTADQAWAAYQALPQAVQRLLVEQTFFKILSLTGTDYNNPDSLYFHQYARGYDAINTLFPAALGYTANNLNGGSNGASQPVQTGNLDIRSSTIQTQQGGNISIFGPGGQALVGSSSAPPFLVDAQGNVVAGPNTQGILTLEKGGIDIFTDRSVLLAQSRIFTEQGGDMLIWSSNGDINAGKGAKTSSEIPPQQYVCDTDHYCLLDAKGQVTGAGIATLQSVAGAQQGSVALVAPRGTVDAGDAGIRVSGSLIVAAQQVANATNIQVQGSKSGVPVVAHVDTGALAAASAASVAAEQSAVSGNSSGERAASLITVEVVGFGSPDEEEKKKLREKSKPQG